MRSSRVSIVDSLLIFLGSVAAFAGGSASAAPAFVVCTMVGDKELEKACDTTEKRLREAGFEVFRVDGPDFKGSEGWREAFKKADKPFVHVNGHGEIDPRGFHKLFLGGDGAKRSYPTALVVRELKKLNAGAQILVESCRSGRLLRDLDPNEAKGVGVTSRGDEYAPAESYRDHKTRDVNGAEGLLSRAVFDLLNLPPNDFKFWSGGSCSIGGDALREYLSWKLMPTDIKLECQIEGFDDTGKTKRLAAEIRKDELACERKVESLRGVRRLETHVVTEYEFRVACAGVKSGETLRVFGRYASPEALQKILDGAKGDREPTPTKWRDYEDWDADQLAGRGCKVEPGYFAKRVTAQATFRAMRQGRPAILYSTSEKLAGELREEVAPFLADWNKDLPESRINPKKSKDAGLSIFGADTAPPPRKSPNDPLAAALYGVSTPDLDNLTLRHPRCTTEGVVRKPPVGAGLSFRGLVDSETH